jgi:hypothetical protein
VPQWAFSHDEHDDEETRYCGNGVRDAAISLSQITHLGALHDPNGQQVIDTRDQQRRRSNMLESDSLPE